MQPNLKDVYKQGLGAPRQSPSQRALNREKDKDENNLGFRSTRNFLPVPIVSVPQNQSQSQSQNQSQPSDPLEQRLDEIERDETSKYPVIEIDTT